MRMPKLPFMGDKLQYCDLAFVPLFVIFIITALKSKSKIMRDKSWFLPVALALASSLSLFHSPYKKEVYYDTLGLFYLVALFFVIAGLAKDRKMLIRADTILSISGALVSLLGIIFFTFYNFYNMKWLSPFMYARVTDTQTALLPFRRSASLLTLPEMFVNFSLLSLASLFILLDKQRTTRAKAIVGLSVAVVISATFLAFGRSSIGLMLLCCAVTFRFRKKNIASYCLFTLCVILFFFLFISAAILWFYTIAPSSFFIDNSGIAHLLFNTKWDTRYYLAKAGLIMGNSHPWLGSGLGSFTNHFSAFLSPYDLSSLAARRGEPIESLRIDPHSLYFGAIAEIGWLGLLILLSFLFSVLRRLQKGMKGEYACYVFFFAIAGFLINGLFVDVLSMRSLWLALSLGTAYAHLSREGQVKA